MNDASFLHALIVAAANDFAVADQNRPNGNSARSQSLFRLIDGSLEERVHKGQGLVMLW